MDVSALNCVNYAKEVLEKTGRFPTAQHWSVSAGAPCSAKSLGKIFGSWTTFRRACGLELFHPVYSDETALRNVCIEFGTKIFVETGDFPNEKDWIKLPGRPCGKGKIKRLFGWTQYRLACGVEQAKTSYRYDDDVLKPLCISTFNEFNCRTGRYPDARDWYIKNGFPCGPSKVVRIFGGWPEFQLACGVQPKSSALSESELKNMVISTCQQFIHNEKRFPHSKDFTWRNGFPCHKNDANKLFGNGRGLKLACGWYDRSTVASNEEMFLWVRRQCDEHRGPLETACWIWSGAKIGETGYGAIGFKRKRWLVHVLMYTITSGPVPKNLQILHSCDIKSCCNPQHLRAGTASDNRRDHLERHVVVGGKQKVRKPPGLIGLPLLDHVSQIVNRVVYEANLGECWEYPGSGMYPHFGYTSHGAQKYQRYQLHRYTCALVYDLNYEDHSWRARHLCHNKRCVNPSHIVPGTSRDNGLDSREHNRHTKLNVEIVRQMRHEWEETNVGIWEFCQEWTKKVNLTAHGIWGILRYRSWKDVE